MGKVIRRGVVAGLLGGCALALVLLLLGEGPIQSAIDRETSHVVSEAEDVLVSRDVQVVGGALGAILIGSALGLVFSVVFAATRHALPGRTDRTRAFVLAGVAFVAVYVVPFLKYPPAPPGVGDPETIAARTGAYVMAVALSILAPIAAWRVSTLVLAHLGRLQLRLPMTVGLWVIIAALGMLILPGPSEEISTSQVSEFRATATIGALAMWTSIGTAFGWPTAGSES